jgi:predicted PurR-regulated permease PerM
MSDDRPTDTPSARRRAAADATATSAVLKALRIVSAHGSLTGSTTISALLAAVLTIHLLQTTRPALLPLTLGLLLAFLTWPLVRLAMRARLPRTLSSTIVVLVLVIITLGSLYALSGPAADWLRRAPIALQAVEFKLLPLKLPIEQIKQATDAVKEAASVDSARATNELKVEVREPGVLEVILDSAPQVMVQIGITLVALFFFLAWGDDFMRHTTALFNDDTLRSKADRVLRDVRREVSHYLATITLINLGLGATVALLLLVLGYPNPMLWGVSVALLNFAPFVGAIVALLGLAIVGLVSFDTFTPVLTATVCFGVLTTLEGYFVTPAILGRRLELDPLAILLSLVGWGWLWGPAGVLMAVPLLVCARIIWRSVHRVNQGAAPSVDALDPPPGPAPDDRPAVDAQRGPHGR